MITDSFDLKTEACIHPQSIYEDRRGNPLCETIIVTYSEEICKRVTELFACTQIAQLHSVNGSTPVYSFSHQGKLYGFYRSMIGSACAGNFLEEAHCVTGAGRFVFFGSCGALKREITSGKLIIPTHAYRDEGLSYHYAPPADYITMQNADQVRAVFEALHYPYVMAKTWTTDAFYRETRGNMELRKAEGCAAVEMECAGLQAVSDFRGFKLYTFLYSGDLLDAPEWEQRILGKKEENDRQMETFYIALELAERL